MSDYYREAFYKLEGEMAPLRAQLSEAQKELADEMKASDEMSHIYREQLATSQACVASLEAALEEMKVHFTQTAELGYPIRIANVVSRIEAALTKPSPLEANDDLDEMLQQLDAIQICKIAFESVLATCPKEPSNYMCIFCDMGGAGYSSKGDGHHDDTRDVCPVLKCQQALAALNEAFGEDPK